MEQSSGKVIVIYGTHGNFHIPAEVVAESRAKYYAQHDVDSGDENNFDDAYQAEFEYSMSDDYELTDWIRNNMNWEDFKDHAVYVPIPQPDPQDWIMHALRQGNVDVKNKTIGEN